MGLADLHIHTIYNYDGTASVPAVLTRARQIGLDVIAITDHDEISGSLKALELAPTFGVEVIPGTEVTTAEGDLLALNVTEKIERNLTLVETVLRVSDLGGFCIAPHPMANGIGMKSLSAYSISKALHKSAVSRALIAIETYNATSLDRTSNHYARILADWLDITPTASSDAHVVEAIGLGVTEFDGHTAGLADCVAKWKYTTSQAERMELGQDLGKLGCEPHWQHVCSSRKSHITRN